MMPTSIIYNLIRSCMVCRSWVCVEKCLIPRWIKWTCISSDHVLCHNDQVYSHQDWLCLGPFLFKTNWFCMGLFWSVSKVLDSWRYLLHGGLKPHYTILNYLYYGACQSLWRSLLCSCRKQEVVLISHDWLCSSGSWSDLSQRSSLLSAATSFPLISLSKHCQGQQQCSVIVISLFGWVASWTSQCFCLCACLN